VVRSSEIHSFDPEDISDFIEANEKVYRLATTYDIPDEVGHM
jgi:1,2-phenylacetyl-CoA epoxidase PaaB subunit